MAVNRGIEAITAAVADDCGFVSASQRTSCGRLMPSRSAPSRTLTPAEQFAEAPLPFYVQPAADEALISWLDRSPLALIFRPISLRGRPSASITVVPPSGGCSRVR
jgi:hypothetical protein